MIEVEPLTRRGCKRLAKVEGQIRVAIGLDGAALVLQARSCDENAPEFLPAEALVYFIRRSFKAGDRPTMNSLFRALFERCVPFFRGKFRGVSDDVREDLQQEVMKKLAEDLLADDDRGDFIQVRFWVYLERRAIDACRKTFRHDDDVESLDTGWGGEEQGGRPVAGRSKLDQLADRKLTPEEFTQVAEGLAALPPKMRKVFVMRHRMGFEIGSDRPEDDDASDPTLARLYSVPGRTIRNWLKKAAELLAACQEK